MSASTRSAYRSSAPRPPAPGAIDARSSPLAGSRDDFSAAPVESGCVIDMLGTFRGSPAQSYDGALLARARATETSLPPWLVTLIRKADAGGTDYLVRIAVVERLRGVTELLELHPGVEVPGAVCRRTSDGHRGDARDAEVTERVIDEVREKDGPFVELVVVADAEADLDRHRDAGLRTAVTRAHAELEILARLGPAVSLVSVGGVELERRNDPRMQRRLPERGTVVATELEHQLLDVVEARARARIRRVRDPETAAGKAERERRVEIRLIPDLVARASETRLRAAQSRVARVQAVPRPEIEARALQPPGGRLEREVPFSRRLDDHPPGVLPH